MDGSTKMAGAVAGLKHEVYKISTCGYGRNRACIAHWRGSRALQRQNHEFVDNNIFTSKRAAQYKRWKEMKNGTVGMVVLDAKGNNAGTPGMMGKFGRVGMYYHWCRNLCDNKGAAVSCRTWRILYPKCGLSLKDAVQGLSVEKVRK